jgi:hypothetical protein
MAVFEADPTLGKAFVQHADNVLHIRRELRQFRQGRGVNPPRAAVEMRIRAWTAQNVKIEQDILSSMIHSGEKLRDTDIHRLHDWLTSDDADLTAEPPRLRDAVEEYRRAEGPRREDLSRRLHTMATRRIDGEITNLRDRLKELKADPAREVDLRVATLMSDNNAEIHASPRRPADEPPNSQPGRP